MGRTFSTYGEENKYSVYRILVGKTEGKRELGRLRRRRIIILKRILDK
jgi:hypothetical protein